MEWTIRLEARTGWGEVTTCEIGALRRSLGELTADGVGLGLAEAKALGVAKTWAITLRSASTSSRTVGRPAPRHAP